MVQFNPISKYLIAVALIPGVVMFGVRYFRKAAAQRQASSIPFMMPELVLLPQISLVPSSAIHMNQIAVSIDSPFWFEDMNRDKIDNSVHHIPTNASHRIEDELDEISVTSILPHPKNPLAIIDSKPRRVGDEVLECWWLIAIEGRTRTIVLRRVTGELVSLGLTDVP